MKPPAVSLREVRVADLPILFEHQREPAAAQMAGFPSRDRPAFMAHWTKIMASPSGTLRTILYGEVVAGYICAWSDGSERLVGYWIGRDLWGRGIASDALAKFLQCETTRPLTARVVSHNAASIRVLEKVGFSQIAEAAIALPGGAAEKELVYRY